MFPTLYNGTVAGAHVELQSYAVLLVGGLLGGVALALIVAWRRGLPIGRSALVLGLAAASAGIGGRLLHVATFLPLFREDPGAALDTGVSGLALYGGLTAAVVVAVIASRALHVHVWRLADASAPGIALGIAAAKIGCGCAGCCHGVITRGPLGVVYGLGSPAHGAQLLAGVADVLGPVQPVLPVQLFEVAGALAVGASAFALGRRAMPGTAFLATAAGFSAVRLALHPLRWIDSGPSAPSWLYPAMYVAVIAACGVIAAWRLCTEGRACASVIQDAESAPSYARPGPLNRRGALTQHDA